MTKVQRKDNIFLQAKDVQEDIRKLYELVYAGSNGSVGYQGGPLTIDLVDYPSGENNLTLKRNNAVNTNTIVSQSMRIGGRTTFAYRDDIGDDIARLVSHNEDDIPGVAGGFRVYGRRLLPRLDGNMMDNRFTIQSYLDFTNIYSFGSTFNMETHDTDNNLHTDETTLTIFRSPGDYANESTEFGRSRTSGVGSNWFHRDLPDADTNGPLVRISQDNTGDNQPALKIEQAGTLSGASGLIIDHLNAGAALQILNGYLELTEITVPAGPGTDKGRLFPRDSGGGRTLLSWRTSSDTLNIYGALIGSAAWNPGSLTNGQSERFSVTVTGAALGDMAVAGLVGIAASGWNINATVIATNTVEVTITNNTGGTVDLGNSTVRAIVWKVA